MFWPVFCQEWNHRFKMNHLSTTVDEHEYWPMKKYCFLHMFLFFFHQVKFILCRDGNSKLFLMVKIFHAFLFFFRQLMCLRYPVGASVLGHLHLHTIAFFTFWYCFALWTVPTREHPCRAASMDSSPMLNPCCLRVRRLCRSELRLYSWIFSSVRRGLSKFLQCLLRPLKIRSADFLY